MLNINNLPKRIDRLEELFPQIIRGLSLYEEASKKIIVSSINKFSSFQDDCHKLREDTNEIVHNEVDLDKERAMDLTHRTFQLIHELYEAN